MISSTRSSLSVIARSAGGAANSGRVVEQVERYMTIREFFTRQATLGDGQAVGRAPPSIRSLAPVFTNRPFLAVETRLGSSARTARTWMGRRWELDRMDRNQFKWSIGGRRWISNSITSGDGGDGRMKKDGSKSMETATSVDASALTSETITETKKQCPDCPHPPQTLSQTSQPSSSQPLASPSASPSQQPQQPSQPQQFHPPPDYPPFIRRLLARIPHPHSTHPNTANPSSHPNPSSSSSSHPNSHPNSQQYYRPPTKDDLLRASSNFFQRLTIRFKWFSIRGWRRFNADDLSAFASWFVMGNTLWIIIGTTTFFSAVFATLNSLSLQSYVAKGISDYLTKNTGFSVIFESAIVPRWGASIITFRNVYVSRRPVDDDEDEEDDDDEKEDSDREDIGVGRLEVASPLEAASLSNTTNSTIPTAQIPADPKRSEREEKIREINNYTMFDVNFEEVDVTLSLVRWLSGKGLVKEAKITGVRGVIDRRHVWWDYSVPLVPADFRHQTQVGDFEFESLQIEDFLVTVYQPGGQRPFNVSIFNATIGPFRKRWMFYDLMSADGITGQYDNCLFSLHMPQKLGKRKKEDDKVKRMARFRIDGLPIEHAQYATGFTGPISWITSGKLDAVLDIKFPTHPDDEVDINALLSQISQNITEIARETGMMDAGGKDGDSRAAAEAAQAAMDAQLANRQKDYEVNPGQHRLAKPALRAPGSDVARSASKTVRLNETTDVVVDVEEPPREVTLDIDLRFRDLKAAVPLYTTDLSVRNNALIRPIVAFINANRTLVPIHCTVKSPLNDFDGSWTLFETGLTSKISEQIYAALAYHVSSGSQNSQRIRTVGAWGIQRGTEAVLHTLRTVVDPIHSSAQATVNA